MSTTPSADALLGPLKDFQRRTVDYVFHRMYEDDPPAHRFLVADEVGLGKTMVARGILARVLNRLYPTVDRIDVLYVCSNAAIAAQNLNRLNVTGQPDLTFATRLTLLPAQIRNLKGNKINLVSFTPGTTFDLKSRGGRMDERADICRMLRDELDLPRNGFANLLQGSMSHRNWKAYLKKRVERDLDPDLVNQYVAAVRRDRGLMRRLVRGCERFRSSQGHSTEDRQLQYEIVGRLRQKLADVCIQALEPDLIILDEFQRFRDLLERDEEKQTEAARLAQDLMRFKDARVLLLSATPYRMLTLGGETEEDHYEDFMATLDFLLHDDRALARLREDFRRYRQLLVSGRDASAVDLAATRDRIEATLLSVMVRTERVAGSAGRNAMLEDVVSITDLRSADLKQARLLDRVARAVEAEDTVEYWKSAPYLLNMMKEYKVKEALVDRLDDPPEDVVAAMREYPGQLLGTAEIEAYREVDPQNGRLRRLIDDTIGAGYWRLLWMPPSLPYWSPGGAYAEVESPTKALVFSSWNVVPDVIAGLASYDAERRILESAGETIAYTDLTVKRRGLLVFRTGERGPESLTTLALLYPSPTLAREIDPLRLALAGDPGTGPASPEEVVERAKEILAERLRETGAWPGTAGDVADPQWYWAAPILLDRQFAPEVGPWLASHWSALGEGRGHEAEGAGAFGEHVRRFSKVFREGMALGPAPDDLLDVLAHLALAGPGVCALRSLWRVAQTDELQSPPLLTAAARLALGLRSLFNNPDSVLLLRGSEGEEHAYWRQVLQHGMEGNLAALLDEYVHILREALGLVHHADAQVAGEIAATAAEALSIRSSNIRVDEYAVQAGGTAIDLAEIRLRCRFALRFGELKDDSGETLHRIGAVREAFNSPFRPFILASTSIGQEGLDFHPWCHAVYHWNLPSNPVDLEQREGRVHRYKSHAVRKNVASAFGLETLGARMNGGKDPWGTLFELAREGRPAGTSDIVPYWIYEIDGGARVERRVPILPFSREEGRFERLKASLAIYRLAFGQPRQEDLLAHLRRLQAEDDGAFDMEGFRISLEPPLVPPSSDPVHPDLWELIERRTSVVQAAPPDSGGNIFFEVLRERSGDEAHDTVRVMEEWAQDRRLRFWFGPGQSSPSMHIGWSYPERDDWHPLFAVYSYQAGPKVTIPFKKMKVGAFQPLARRIELLERLNEIEVWSEPLGEEAVRRYPSFPLTSVGEAERLEAFFEIISWMIEVCGGE